MLGGNLSHTLHKVGMHVALVGHTLGGHKAIGSLTAVPGMCGHFVAAYMYGTQRHTGLSVGVHQRAHNYVPELIWAIEGGVHQVVVEVLRGGVARAVAVVYKAQRGIAAATVAGLHGAYRSAAVTRRVEFRNHFNSQSVGELQQFDILIYAVEAVGRSFGIGVAVAAVYAFKKVCVVALGISAARAHLGQFGQLGNLNTPTLVVAYMEVQHIQAISGHEAYKALHVVEACKVAGHVNHQSAVRQVGPVLNVGHRQFAVHVDRALDALQQTRCQRLGILAVGVHSQAVAVDTGAIIIVALVLHLHRLYPERFGTVETLAAEFHLLGRRNLHICCRTPCRAQAVVDGKCLGTVNHSVVHPIFIGILILSRPGAYWLAHIAGAHRLASGYQMHAVGYKRYIAQRAGDKYIHHYRLTGGRLSKTLRSHCKVAGKYFYKCVGGVDRAHSPFKLAESQAFERRISLDYKALHITAAIFSRVVVAESFPGNGIFSM